MGKTQKEMAADLDITPEHLTRCLTKGKISKTWLISIAQYLDVDIRWLSGDSDTPLYYWAEQRTELNGDELLSSYMHYLGWSPEEQKLLTNEDIGKLKFAIKMIVDTTMADAKQRKEKGE